MPKFKSIEELIEAEGIGREKCIDCPYFAEWFERHPYGMGYAEEYMCDCLVDEDSNCQRMEQQEDEDD